MKSLDAFLQSSYCILLLAASALVSIVGAPQSSDRTLQLFTWAGAFAFPVLLYILLSGHRKAETAGVFARYPGFATAAFFFVEAAAIYRWYPGAMSRDTIVSVIGLYLLFAILTVAELRARPS